MCSKVKYDSEFDAMLALFRIQNTRNLEQIPSYENRSYWCDECNSHHLTSKGELK